ncbi:MAG: hypothetical protein KatS3mg029_0622 [Saprospiraceae bacterium]|nr:MAG: hypothetical protein KatS3mg029_0622 [Saprospiraceae bacterium]
MKSLARILWLCLLGGWIWPGCTEPPPPVLNYKERLLVDSLYNKGVDSLRPILDSICQVHFDSIVQSKVDSMMQERLHEIEVYMERIRRLEQQHQSGQ